MGPGSSPAGASSERTGSTLDDAADGPADGDARGGLTAAVDGFTSMVVLRRDDTLEGRVTVVRPAVSSDTSAGRRIDSHAIAPISATNPNCMRARRDTVWPYTPLGSTRRLTRRARSRLRSPRLQSVSRRTTSSGASLPMTPPRVR